MATHGDGVVACTKRTTYLEHGNLLLQAGGLLGISLALSLGIALALEALSELHGPYELLVPFLQVDLQPGLLALALDHGVVCLFVVFVRSLLIVSILFLADHVKLNF
jgi:hypothetical protein